MPHCRLFALLALSVLLAACASAPQSRLLETSPPVDVSRQIILDDTPFFPQRAYQCGPAALATMLGHRGIAVTPDELTGQVYLERRKGSLQIEMIATARDHGLLAYRLEPNLAVILREIDAGNPVLVLQDLAYLPWPRWHYAVVVGYDLDDSVLVLRSGTHARLETSLVRFERSWSKAGYWAYVLVPPGVVPATASPLDYVSASHDLEQSGQPELALIALRRARDTWPTESIVRMALGNAAYSTGRYDEAMTAYVEEIEASPEHAAAWNNLAYALASLNCRAEAVQAIRCATRLQPQDENLRRSLTEIENWPAGKAAACGMIECPR